MAAKKGGIRGGVALQAVEQDVGEEVKNMLILQKKKC
jgi:hypothetical protein